MKSSMKYVIGIVLSFSFLFSFLAFHDAIYAQTPLEKIKLNENTIRMQNSFGQPVLDIQLLENTNQCLVDCYAILRIYPYQTITLPQSPDSNFRWDFLKAAPEMRGLKRYGFQILGNVSYTGSIPVYENQSYGCNYDNITGEYETCWGDVEIGSTEETRYKDEYIPFGFWGETLESGKDYYIKIIGEKYPALGENNVDWIPTVMGIQINEWEWWNGSWSACRNITIPANLVDNLNMPNFAPMSLRLNSSRINYAIMKSDGTDIRVVNAPCGMGGTNVPHEIDTWDATGTSIVNFRPDLLASTSMNYSIYYGNLNTSDTGSPVSVYNNSFVFVSHFYNDTATNVIDVMNRQNATIKWPNKTNSVAGYLNGGKGVNITLGWTTGSPLSLINATYSADFTSINNFTSLVFTKFWNFTYRAEIVTISDTNTQNRAIIGTDTASGSDDLNTCVQTTDQLCNAITTNFVKNQWYMITLTYDSYTKVTYVNGSSVHSAAKTGTWPPERMILFSGKDSTTNPDYYYHKGVIDEYSFSNTSRPIAWINMTYKSFNDMLITYGDETTAYSEATNESDGDSAIVQGIMNSEIYPGCSIYGDQQIYIRYLDTGQDGPHTFDKVAVYGNQTWAFNYVSLGESFTNMNNLSTTVYVWEKENLTAEQITNEVSGLINATKV